MKKVLKLVSMSVCALMIGSAVAQNEQLVAVDYSKFYDTQVASPASPDCGGYWDERQVEVCDYKTELVDVSYKTCHYEFKYGHVNSPYPQWETRTVKADASCPNSWTVAGPYAHVPGGVYIHQYDTYFTQQESKTVKYNCRMETRTVWVPRNGKYCPINP